MTFELNECVGKLYRIPARVSGCRQNTELWLQKNKTVSRTTTVTCSNGTVVVLTTVCSILWFSGEKNEIGSYHNTGCGGVRL
jgi:hypothetical protein